MAAGTTIGEFVLNLVVDAGKGELTLGGLVKSMGDLEVASVAEITVLSGLANALEKLTMEAINHAVGITHITDATNESTASLERWGRIADALMVAPVANFQEGMKSFDGLLAGAKNGIQSAQDKLDTYNRAGMHFDWRKFTGAGDAIESLRRDEVFQGLPKDRQASLLGQGAIPAEWIALVSQRLTSDKELNRIDKEVGTSGMTDKERESLKLLNRELEIAKLKTDGLKDAIAAFFTKFETGFLHFLIHPIDTSKKFVTGDPEEMKKAHDDIVRYDREHPSALTITNITGELGRQINDLIHFRSSYSSPQESPAPNVTIHVTAPITAKSDANEVAENLAGHIVYHVEKQFSAHFGKTDLLLGGSF